MPAWSLIQVPQHPETQLRIVCKSEGRNGRYHVVAYDGDVFVHGAFYSHAKWMGHAAGSLLMPDFVSAAETKASALRAEANDGLPAIADDVRVPWESNCAGEIFLVSDSDERGVRIGHFQGDAALAAYVVAMHNAALSDSRARSSSPEKVV